METVLNIIQIAGHDSIDELDVNELIEVENDPFMDLAIERVGDEQIIVGHYYTQRGDLMSDPEIVFDVSGDEWIPVEYNQHGFPQIHKHDEDGLNEVASFIDDWDAQLEEQGFVEAAREQFGDNND